MTPYSALCDDFSLAAYLNTRMDLPTGREVVLHFFATMQKSFPRLLDFEKRENGDFVLEEDRDEGHYRWVTLESRRVCSGYVNPPSLEEVDAQHERVLEIAPAHLDLNALDCEALDVSFTFDFLYSGNHDEVVSEALAAHSPLESLIQLPGSRVVNYEPSIMLALDEDCRLQCRLSIETRTSAYQIRTSQFPEAPISVYFTVRQYWSRSPHKSFLDSYRHQRQRAQELIDSQVVPAVLKPLAATIATKQ